MTVTEMSIFESAGWPLLPVWEIGTLLSL